MLEGEVMRVLESGLSVLHFNKLPGVGGGGGGGGVAHVAKKQGGFLKFFGTQQTIKNRTNPPQF